MSELLIACPIRQQLVEHANDASSRLPGVRQFSALVALNMFTLRKHQRVCTLCRSLESESVTFKPKIGD
jgi:hypothetical protein